MQLMDRRVAFEPFAEAGGTDRHNVNTDNNSDY
jgi:hypothetical protein